MMDRDGLIHKARSYLQTLCYEIPNRRLGSEGNWQATSFFAEKLVHLGWDVAEQEFDCLDWKDDGTSLVVGEERFRVSSSPYTLGCSLKAPLVVADTVEAIDQLDTRGILLLKGAITNEQLMPKNFPFYNPENHREMYRLLEQKNPLAIITATGRNPELAGGMYPFPMIEDGDFDIPSVYIKDEDGERLASHAGRQVALDISAERIPARGRNVLGLLAPDVGKRVVVCAHIDAKDHTPGALDNGTGVVILLLLAELLEGYKGGSAIEILALNGEDHYSAQGQKEYIRLNKGFFEQVVLAINMDLVGYQVGHSAYSLYGCPAALEKAIRENASVYEGLHEGPQWYQGDHSIFIQQGCPAVAVTSERFMELSRDFTHTEMDDVGLVDIGKVVDTAHAVQQIVNVVGREITS